MKKILFLLAFISFISMNAKADATFTNNTNCDLTITVYCMSCALGWGEETSWGNQIVYANGGTLNIPGILSCGNGQTRVARICYADCPSVCVQWVNLTPEIPAPPNCGIVDTYTFPGSLCFCSSGDIIVESVNIDNYVARNP